MVPRGGRVSRYPPGRNMPDVLPAFGGGMLSVPYDMGGLPLRDAGMSQPIPIGALASALANSSPEQQRTVCFCMLSIYVHLSLSAYSSFIITCLSLYLF